MKLPLRLIATVLLSSCASKPVPLVTTHNGKPPVKICARTYWNNTGIPLRQGQRYEFHISGTWTDLSIESNAKGPISPIHNAVMFPARVFLRYSPFRDRHANYFQAIGTIGRGEGKKLPQHAFIIRDGMTYTAPASGTLYVFANDAPWESAYSNNKGHLDLTITKLDLSADPNFPEVLRKQTNTSPQKPWPKPSQSSRGMSSISKTRLLVWPMSSI